MIFTFFLPFDIFLRFIFSSLALSSSSLRLFSLQASAFVLASLVQFPFMGKTNPEVFVAVTHDNVYYDSWLPSDLVLFLKGVSSSGP